MQNIKILLPKFTKYTFGTGNINDKTNSNHIKIARGAMDAGIWFHSSLGYRGVFDVLKIASPWKNYQH